MNITQLISAITPYYNQYRANKSTLTGTESLGIIWEVGELIKKYVEETGLAPHKLYREIYGKSEGAENVAQKSYITREFLSRSYRVRNIFKSKGEIQKLLPRLQKYRLFYQAMPFIDNPSYAFTGKEREQLFKLLNSAKSYPVIMAEIHRLQKEKIGISNPRTQKLQEMSGDKDTFVAFYNYIYQLLKNNDYGKAKKEIAGIDVEFIKLLSKNTGAISLDGLLMLEMEIPKKIPKKWQPFVALIQRLTSKKDPQERRRFRRLIPAHRMTHLGEMLYLLTSENLYGTFRP